MTSRTCSVVGCDQGGKLTREWCAKHYKRWQNHGTVHAPAAVRHSFARPDELKRTILANRRISARGCWEWTRCHSGGYGVLVIDRDQRRLHRVSAVLFLGFDIDSELFVLHRCDNPLCFNPDHLFLGTHEENMRDMVQKGRQAFQNGERGPQARLREVQVRRILLMLELGESQSVISRIFGVAQTTISWIHRGVTWKDLRRKFL